MVLRRTYDRLHDLVREAVAPLDAVADAVPAGSVLELGCGQGLLIAKLVGRCRPIVGVDFDPRKCRMARESVGRHAAVEIVEDDVVEYLRRSSERFDTIILSDTLSSIPPDVQDEILRLAREHLSERGRLVLKIVDTVPLAKAALARAMFVLTYRILRASKSHGQRVYYRSHAFFRRELEQLGLDTRVTLLHRRTGHPIPHVLIVAQNGADRGRDPSVQPRVRFVIPNLRMGGQVASLVALRDRLHDAGVDADFLLPSNASATDKRVLARYSRTGSTRRVLDAISLLRNARTLARDPSAILHVMLPTPAFRPLLRLTGFPPERIVAQYEGRTLRLDAETLATLRDDPALIAPRLVVNRLGEALGSLAPAVHHVATVPALARELATARGELHELINLASFEKDEGPLDADLLRELRDPRRVVVAYVGHAHAVKGVDDLVRAFAVAARVRPDLRLVLALSQDGDGRRVVRLARALGLGAPTVTFAGLVPIRGLLASIDWLVLPYRSSITTTLLPSLLLEADAAGCPTIVGRVPEFAHVIRRNSPAVASFPPRDIAALSRLLASCVKRESTFPGGILDLPDEQARLESWHALYRSLVRRGTS